MPRKRIKGRSKLPSITNRLDIQLSKANRRLRDLEKQGNFGKYASRKFIASIQHSKKFSYSRRRNKNIIKLLERDMSESEKRFWLKETEKFNKAPTSSNMGIKNVKQKTIETIARITDKEIDDQDVESLYDLFEEDEFEYFASRLGASYVWACLDEAKESGGGAERLIQLFEQRMTMNSENIRNKARRLYNKYANGLL